METMRSTFLIAITVVFGSIGLSAKAQSIGPLQYSNISYAYDATGRLSNAVYADEANGDRAIAYDYSHAGAITTRFAGPADQVGLEDERLIPGKFALSQNYPNPFQNETTIEYDVPRESKVRIEVFDLIGRRVAVLVDGNIGPGSHKVVWPSGAGSTASGIYFCRMTTPDGPFTAKMVVNR